MVSPRPASAIPELDLIDELERLAEEYKRSHGRAPINVSHWDPSPEFMGRLRDALPLPALGNIAPYRYSYDLGTRTALLAKVGVTDETACALVGENGSSAIIAIANWLAWSGVSEVTVLRPCYFTVPYALSRFGIAVRDVHCQRGAEGYDLPCGLAIPRGGAVWVTHPVYNTGDYGLSTSIPRLQALLEAGVTVVADEALAQVPTDMARVLGGHRRFIGLYTPHKSICMNGLKFSLIAFHKEHEGTFEQWADILAGGLGLSALAAVEHFLSPEFDRYRVKFLALTKAAADFNTDLVQRLAPSASLDVGAIGHFGTVYFPQLAASLGNDLSFLSKLTDATGGIVIPGSRSGFDPAFGFCFRLNFGQDSTIFRSTLGRIYRFLTNMRT